MAAKIEYVVVDGCIQDGTRVVRRGEVYVPPSAELRDILLDEGRIVARGKLDTGSRSARRQSTGGPGAVQTTAPVKTDGGGPDEEEEEEEEEDESDKED
ncbi:hypothetical protein N7381_09730 [Pseudomonas asiatica]|uniref:hypothetical protein n=1 Tax=Pseudomonas asiatica TaxID=2219225 RepID=UPI002448A64F|nr:hypothetical protein [Pseudomonas asiatica]MDH0133525.1 hypothetical protein [Pseudomonas asiatica]